MDKVRLGRALGYGARQAGKSLSSALDAAMAPDPRASATKTGETEARPAAVTTQVAEAYRAVRTPEGRARGQSVLAPIKRFSSVIWLQVTGTFFGLFAMVMGGAVWAHRADFKGGLESPQGQKAGFYVVLFVVFAWFTVSNFVRAGRRGRG